MMGSITLPSHLLATSGPGQEWSPDLALRRETFESFPQQNDAVDGEAYAGKADVPSRYQTPNGAHGLRRSHTDGRLHPKRRHGTETDTSQRLRYQRSQTLPTFFEKSSEEGGPTLTPARTRPSFFSHQDAPSTVNSYCDSIARKDFANSEQGDLFSRLAAFDFAQPNRTIYSPRHGNPFTDEHAIEPFAPNPAPEAPTDPFVDLPAVRDMRMNSSAVQRSASIVHAATEGLSQALAQATADVASKVRQSSVAVMYEKAKTRKQQLQRKPWVQVTFEYSCYLLLVLFVYFVLVGLPLWSGAVFWMYWIVNTKFTVAGTWSVTIGLAVIYAYLPLLLLFEKEPPFPDDEKSAGGIQANGSHNTALIIPCYKAASIIGPTIIAAKRIFPANHIYVVANGNSPTPLDNTEEVCNTHGVNHVWSPIGSKIVAQFVGGHVVSKLFENVLLIDDDCALPPNFPIVSERMRGRVKCIGYTIKSTGPGSTIGSWCQQAQDLEYKLSGMQRAVAGVMGSATFAHGAISLWNTRFLIDTLNTHPGFNVSEDWFFGHNARELGCRIKMCTSVFVETETPSRIFFPEKGGARGGFGEMTVFKQRFYRWNFFFVNGLWYNLKYIVVSWKLGVWELGAKLFVLQEVYETLLYLLAPFVLPISLVVQPAFCGYLLAGTFGLYWLNALIFNEIHLRLRNERVSSVVVYGYYHLYKIALTLVNVASCYYALYKYARYFANRHPKVVENEKALEVVLHLDEKYTNKSLGQGRRLTVTAVGVPQHLTEVEESDR